mmetsp:Transcript_8444/g.35325  ORF Transcript_8444/g.35325 Transcript_8444/m.35325 type:complete len:447 (+) Transcript_8444:1363-2703(+)
MDAPTKAMVAQRPAMPPGRSGTTQENRINRSSFTSPRSRTLPSVDVSMFPPHKSTATFLPLSSGSFPASTAAMPAAPAPSWMSFSSSTRRRSATDMSFSDTVTSLSTRVRSTSKDLGPTAGTARPSASVGPGIVTLTTSPASIAAAMDAQRLGSTPMICTFGLMVLTASATPAMSPPPPTGTTMASMFSASSRISSPTDPAPAMMLKSSNPLMYFMPSSRTYACAASAASAMLSPSRITFAPSARHFVIFVRGAMEGIKTVTGMPSSAPWYASASAWFPALAATTPFFLCSSVSASSELRAPRSLNEPVACCHSCLRKMFISVTALSWRLRTRGVRTTPLRMRKCAVETSSNAGRSWPLTTRRVEHTGSAHTVSRSAGTSSALVSERRGSSTALSGRTRGRAVFEGTRGARSFRPRAPRHAGRGARGVPDSAPAAANIAGEDGEWT